MILTIVGCTGSMSGPKAAASCYLLQAEGVDRMGIPRTYSIVFDLGPGSFGQLWNYVDPTQLDAVFLSHLHGDHCSDLISMQVHRRWFPTGPLGPIPVYSPGDALERVRGLDGFSPHDDFAGEFTFCKLKQNRSIQVGPFKVIPSAAWHSIPSMSFRVEGPREDNPLGESAVFTYSGDTDECEPVIKAAANSDLFLSECGFTEVDEVRGIHMSGVRAGRCAQSSGAKQLVLTHIQPWTDPEIPLQEARTIWRGPLEIAAPGRQYRI